MHMSWNWELLLCDILCHLSLLSVPVKLFLLLFRSGLSCRRDFEARREFSWKDLFSPWPNLLIYYYVEIVTQYPRSKSMNVYSQHVYYLVYQTRRYNWLVCGFDLQIKWFYNLANLIACLQPVGSSRCLLFFVCVWVPGSTATLLTQCSKS